MKTCIWYFKDFRKDNCDYVQEIYEAEQELEALRDRLRIQDPTNFASLEKDIIRFDKFVGTNSAFQRIYSTVFQEIASKHAETIYYDNHVFYELDEYSYNISTAGLDALKKKISEEMYDKH